MLEEIKKENRLYLSCGKMLDLGIKNCFTSKLGGKSHGKIEGLNLGFRVGDRKEDVLENYKLVCSDFGFDFSAMVASRQSHTDNIRVVTKKDCGKGVSAESDIFGIDGLVCAEKNIPLIVYSADCFGVLLAEKNKKAIAAVHSGWRGTEKKIAAKAAEIMKADFSSKPENIIAAVGPGIDFCCFEVEWDTACRFDKKYVFEKGGGKFRVNLPAVIKDDLMNCGIKEENIFFSERCTVCENDIFYSYRSHKDATGRMGAIISL